MYEQKSPGINARAYTGYDEVNYVSFCYDWCHPNQLEAIGRLFGLNPKAHDQCRVLELGCASGGVIIPLAARFPNIEAVALDYTRSQVENAQAQVKRLGLKNCRIEHASIEDVDASWGQFDYIFAHGVFSWVSPQIQDSMFALIENNLTDNGIAALSYNTLPGWGAPMAVRAIMLYYAQFFDNAEEKVRQSLNFLRFITRMRGTDNKDDFYTQSIMSELNMLDNHNTAYIVHDHIERNNHPCLFAEFAARAQAHNLEYLGEHDLVNMYTGHLPPEAQALLQGVADDAVRTGQLIDFIRNQRFRKTLLCKAGQPINRNVDVSAVQDRALRVPVTAETPEADVNLESGQEVSFDVGGNNFRTSAKTFIAMFYTLAEKPYHYRKISEIIEGTAQRLKCPPRDVTDVISDELVRFLFHGFANIDMVPSDATHTIEDYPHIWSVAREQFSRQAWGTTSLLGTITLSDVHRFLAVLMDGSIHKDKLAETLLERFGSTLVFRDNNQQVITDPTLKKESIQDVVSQALEEFKKQGLLSKKERFEYLPNIDGAPNAANAVEVQDAPPTPKNPRDIESLEDPK